MMSEFQIAGFWQALVARLFGKRFTKKDGNIYVTGYIFRGNIVVTNVGKIMN